MRIIFTAFSLLFLVAPSIAKASQGPPEFRIRYPSHTVRVTGENLDLMVPFQSPSLIKDSNDRGDWVLEETFDGSMVLGGRGGLVRNDMFRSREGQVVRQTWISERQDLVAFRHIYTNTSRKDVKLKKLVPFQLDGDQKLFSTPEHYRILTQKTLKNGHPEVVNPSETGSLESDPFMIIHDPTLEEENNLFIGAQSYYHHLFEITMQFSGSPGHRVLSSVSAECDFEGVVVPPAGSRTSQWIVLAQDRDAYRLITDYAERVRKFHQVREPATRPYSAYCTWYYHADKYNEELFRGDIAHFKSEHMPFDVFLIDECWSMNQWGDFVANENFPSGMGWVAGEIRSAGYIPGIWTPPFLIDEGTDLAGNHAEWLLKDSKGDMCTFFMNQQDHYILDCTHPGVLDYLEDAYRKLSREWGFKYFKFDFTRAIFVDSDQQFYDKNATSLEAYRMGLEAIRRGVGGDAYISVCGGHYGSSIGIADSQRSGSDVKSIWKEGEIPKYRQNLLRTWMSEFWHVDPDAMMIRRQEIPLPTDERDLTLGLFTDEEAFTNALNQFVGGGLVSFTEDFATIDDDRKALYRHVIPSVNSPSEPIDLFNPEIPEVMLTHISPVCRDLDDWKILSFMNWSNGKRDYEIVLDGKMLQGLGGDQFLVYHFKKREVVGWYRRGDLLQVQGVDPHHSHLYKIMPWDGTRMAFVGTDLHFSSGGVEVAEIVHEDDRVRGLLDTDWEYPVRIVYVIPDTSEKGFSQKSAALVPGQRRFYLD